ncbi:MAG: hypothetical protein HY831_04560 [Candidatus Aenigmarchaeota archaeon]|nr:hypothetical protein [Candidatus Aenigmarchaeota archaeon]
MGKLYVVNFDMDQVCYKGISTSHVADRSIADATHHLRELVENRRWFAYDDFKRWNDDYNKGQELSYQQDTPVVSVPILARCLTDFLYKMKKDGFDESVITKEQTIQGKQMILGGISMGEIRSIAYEVPWTEGLLDAVNLFRHHGLKLYGSSDGLGPFVCHQMQKLGFDDKGYVPALIDIDGDRRWFQEHMLGIGDATLTGDVGKYNKAQEFFRKMEEQGIPLDRVAAIDDSGANVESLLLPIQQAGGLAVGYNPTDAHRPTFEKNSTPILRGTDLRTFSEVVLDRGTLVRNCE